MESAQSSCDSSFGHPDCSNEALGRSPPSPASNLNGLITLLSVPPLSVARVLFIFPWRLRDVYLRPCRPLQLKPLQRGCHVLSCRISSPSLNFYFHSQRRLFTTSPIDIFLIIINTNCCCLMDLPHIRSISFDIGP